MYKEKYPMAIIKEEGLAWLGGAEENNFQKNAFY